MAMAGDSLAAHMAASAMIGELGSTIIHAAADTVVMPWRVAFPKIEGSLWADYEESVLRVVRGRRPTATDSSVSILSLSELQMHGDTLVAYFSIGWEYRCGDRLVGGGTGYVMRAIRNPFGWRRPETKHAWDSDSIPCRRQ